MTITRSCFACKADNKEFQFINVNVSFRPEYLLTAFKKKIPAFIKFYFFMFVFQTLIGFFVISRNLNNACLCSK